MSRRGLTIAEVIVSFSIFALLGVLLAYSLKQGLGVWTRSGSSSDAQTELRRVYSSLYSDLLRTDFSTVRRTVVGASLPGGGYNGDALWFLSAEDPAGGSALKKADGTPFWQRNILYYSIIPSNHDSLFHASCQGNSDALGYDTYCPHKVLIRQVIDGGGTTDPADESTEEQVLSPAEITDYILVPAGYSAVYGPNTESCSIRGRNLSLFRVQLEPEAELPGEVRTELRTAEVEAARRAIRIGSESLEEFTRSLQFSVFP